MRLITFSLFALTLCIILPLFQAVADTVTLVNGDRFTGRLLESKGKLLHFQTEYTGKIKVQWQYVQSLETEDPALLIFDSGDTRSVLFVEVNDNKVEFQDSNDRKLHTLNASAIVGISPESWMKNKSGFWNGRVNFSIKTENGSSEEAYVNFDGDVTYKRKRDRLRLTGELENDSKVSNITGETKTTKDKWLLKGSYNYFLYEKFYLGASLSGEHDPLADLDLRTSAGPLIGYQFFESKLLNLTTEIGMMSVSEEYRDSEDIRYVLPAWHLNFDKYIIEKRLQLYHEQYGVIKLNNNDQWYFKSWTGFRFPLGQGILATAEYKWEYNNQTVNNNNTTESTFRLKIGYKW